MASAMHGDRVVARVTLKDGRVGVKVLPDIPRRINAYRRGLLLSGQVATIEIFRTSDPYFSRFPKSSALNLFFPQDPDFNRHFPPTA